MAAAFAVAFATVARADQVRVRPRRQAAELRGAARVQAGEEVNSCGKDLACHVRDLYSVRFNCRLDLRGDGFEFSRDPSEIKAAEGDDIKLPRSDICDLLPIVGKHTLKF